MARGEALADQETLIDSIYEAAVIPEKWPAVFDALSPTSRAGQEESFLPQTAMVFFNGRRRSERHHGRPTRLAPAQCCARCAAAQLVDQVSYKQWLKVLEAVRTSYRQSAPFIGLRDVGTRLIRTAGTSALPCAVKAPSLAPKFIENDREWAARRTYWARSLPHARNRAICELSKQPSRCLVWNAALSPGPHQSCVISGYVAEAEERASQRMFSTLRWAQQLLPPYFVS
jgi:hypothetical protein